MRNPINTAQVALEKINHRILAIAVETLSEEKHLSDQSYIPPTGGVLAIAIVRLDEHVDFASISIGKIRNNFGRCAHNASEKIRRLSERRSEEGNNEVASSISANDKLGAYGGCIVFDEISSLTPNKEVYISFSGAPADIDEALAFVIGEKLGYKTPSGYGNTHIELARELLADLI